MEKTVCISFKLRPCGVPLKLSIDDIPDQYLQIILERMTEDWKVASARRDLMLEDVTKMTAEIDTMETIGSIGSADDSRSGVNLALEALASLTKTIAGRVKRGERSSDWRFLRQRNGTGATLNEIKDATKTKHATARRIVHIFKEMNIVTCPRIRVGIGNQKLLTDLRKPICRRRKAKRRAGAT